MGISLSLYVNTYHNYFNFHLLFFLSIFFCWLNIIIDKLFNFKLKSINRVIFYLILNFIKQSKKIDKEKYARD